MYEMTQWQISFPIDGLHDVIKEPNSKITIDKVKFYYCKNERIGSVIVDSDKQCDAENEAAYQINKALSKICFVYNTEANVQWVGFWGARFSKWINFLPFLGWGDVT